MITETDFLKELSTPGAVAMALIWLHTRLNRLEDRHDAIAEHLGIPIAKRQAKWRKVLFPFAIVSLSFFAVGCARFVGQMSETDKDGLTRTTQVRVTAFGDTRQVIDKLKVTHGKTQSVGASVEQESTTTNAVRALESLQAIIQSLPK